MLLSDKKTVHIHKYPYAEKRNPVLHRIIKENAEKMDKGALMTSWYCEHIKEFKLIGDYVYNLIINFQYTLYNPIVPLSENYSLKLHHLWGQLYNKGYYQDSHCHLPFHWSFVYFVNTPRGSSPLVFTQNGKKIKAESGKLLIFPGNVAHHVPKNNCEGRSIIAGNFYYKVE